MSDNKMNGIDAIEFVGKVLLLTPIAVAIFIIAMGVIFPGNSIPETTYLAMTIMTAGLICLIFVASKRYREGKDSAK
jgi:hypothetical protein